MVAADGLRKGRVLPKRALDLGPLVEVVGHGGLETCAKQILPSGQFFKRLSQPEMHQDHIRDGDPAMHQVLTAAPDRRLGNEVVRGSEGPLRRSPVYFSSFADFHLDPPLVARTPPRDRWLAHFAVHTGWVTAGMCAPVSTLSANDLQEADCNG